MEFPHLNIPYLNKFKNLDLMHKKMNNSKFPFNKSKLFLGKCTSKKTQKVLGLPTAAVSNDTLAFRAEEREPGFATSWCFQPIQKICSSNWIISFPKVRGENIEYLKPPPSFILTKKTTISKTCHIETHGVSNQLALVCWRVAMMERHLSILWSWVSRFNGTIDRSNFHGQSTGAPMVQVPTWEIKP